MKEGARVFLATVGAVSLFYLGAIAERDHSVLQKTSDAYDVVSYHPRAWTRELMWSLGNASSRMSRFFWDTGDSIKP